MVWPPQGDDSPSFAFKAVCCCVVQGPALDVFETRSTTQNSEGVCKCGCPFGGKWWKVRTWAGTLHMEAFDSCGEGATPLGSSDETFSGSQTIDPEGCFPGSCSFIDLCATSSLEQDGSPAGPSCNPMTPSYPSDGTETDTQVKYTGSGICQPFGDVAVVVTGELTDTYSEEDTTDDAIARMLSHAGASEEDGSDNWTLWDPNDAASYYAPDSDSFGCFGYNHAVWRLRRNHLLPSTEYTVSVEIWRATWDGFTTPDPGDYSLYATQEVNATTDATGYLKTAPVVIPNESGTVTQTKKSTLTCVPT